VRAPRVPMALSFALHGAAILLLFAAGAAGSMGSEEPLMVELALASPSSSESENNDARDVAVELPAAEEAPPVDFSTMVKPIDLSPTQEPPPLDVSELKPVEPKSAPPPKPQKPQAAPKSAATKPAASPNFGSGSDAQQAAAGFLPIPAVVWEGKPRYRHPPTPPVYPPRAVELNQQGEVLVRVRLDPEGTAVEIVLHRPSGFSMLDRAAIAAVKGWQFLPAMRDGRPVAAWVEIPVRFHLR
jgi:periplasmic protein TonB